MTTTRTMIHATRAGGCSSVLVALVFAAAALPGCRGDRSDKPPRQFFPDLDDQPKWKPQSQSDFFVDGRTMRRPPAGSVPFGRVSFITKDAWAQDWMNQRTDFLKEDAAFYEGKAADGAYVDGIPVEVTPAMIERGRNRYNIYCVVCHGYAGDGKGMVGSQWSAPLPSFHDDKYSKPDPSDPKGEKYKDGYIFHTARYGVVGPDGQQKMPGYAHALNERDAWAVVSYFRAIQASHRGTLNDVPAGERPALERSRADAQAAQLKAQPPAAAPPGDAKPGDTKPGEPKPAEPKPVEKKSGGTP